MKQLKIELNQKYFYIKGGLIHSSIWSDLIVDLERHIAGNAFVTHEEAAIHLAKQLGIIIDPVDVKTELLNLAGKLATAANKVVTADVFTLSSAIADLNEALNTYNNKILENLNK
jgi:hypothetical protein